MFKPMLAGSLKAPFILPSHRFPLYASAKLDGVRATIQNSQVMARSLKFIANDEVQELLGRAELNGMDGELIVGNPTDPDVFNRTSTLVGTQKRSIKGQNLVFWVFDVFVQGYGFADRYRLLQEMVTKAQEAGLPVKLVPHTLIKTQEELLVVEEEVVAHGYEGLMIRSLRGPYKQGRSTENEGYLLKLKRFVDTEGVIISINEQMKNNNPTQINELGQQYRSSHKENKTPAGMLGSFLVKEIVTGIEHKVSPGHLTMAECKQMWEQRESYIGQTIKYKYQPTGVKDKPRFSEFIGLRNPNDL